MMITYTLSLPALPLVLLFSAPPLSLASWVAPAPRKVWPSAASRTPILCGHDMHASLLDDMTLFLQREQQRIIHQLEQLEQSFITEETAAATFTTDPWGNRTATGGLTRVLQGGTVIEKGACSVTVIRNAKLSKERAASLLDAIEGELYSAVALSMVLHSKHPMVPTFRSDVRLFVLRDKAWFGGGADLTPYYVNDDDIRSFHTLYKELCDEAGNVVSYESMKQACDDYFYLPARAEHRGTGGIFFDKLPVSNRSIDFAKRLVQTWMPSWIPIVQKRNTMDFSEQEKQWQLLRRGRYLEFNLLYDRGVQFGLANQNPRVEGVMVSAPPVIAFDYNHKIEPGSREEKLVNILRKPRTWV
jgi:coproporphyrinogen III oxidase